MSHFEYIEHAINNVREKYTNSFRVAKQLCHFYD